ncbi:MAG: GNAT family N-acetyltransferase [Planctomycetes bacterium]|nr:GNAT family N-acetyltransferase [Planctomycetota bacterium]
MNTSTSQKVRVARIADLPAVVKLDAELTGESKQLYWREVFAHFLKDSNCIALAIEGEAGVEGYLFGEVRAFEFGSSECGWIVALGVHPDRAREGCASALLNQARECFQTLGVHSLRTMVQRTDVPFLSFFRNHGFVGGPFVQLELDLEDSEA